ncbi:MAG: T9SS type A sorting domain-containing protein [Ignavibacteriae bacterium]|nr:T9SS type A sorting domain-containing protein [Ignavibacteriota bacterium]
MKRFASVAALLALLAVLLYTRYEWPATFAADERFRYDGPALAARMEFERTKDPATGRVPRERLLAALEQTRQSKFSVLNSPQKTNALVWSERGPNSDVTGPSNGNTRANSGIASGRIRAIIVDSSDATHKTVWIGGVSGGLWKTTDITVSPATWTLVNDFLSNLAIADICQDPRVGFQNIMYFCTGESYYNADAVQGNGVFKSIDNGVTWTLLASTSTYVSGTRILCDYLGNVYLATRGTGLLRSTDGGTSWTDITPSGLPSDICDLEITTTGAAGRLHVVSGIFTTQAYRFTDIPVTVTSATWTAPTTAFPSYLNRAEICVSGSTLYALPVDGSDQVPTIYKSTDGGANWAATGAQPTAGWTNGQGWYNLGCDIDPTSGGATCIVGAIDNWKTTDGGGSWTKISEWVGTVGQYVHADVHKILFWDGGNKMLFGCDGGVHYSSDKGTTIRDRNVGLRIKQFYSCAIHPIVTNYFLAGAQDNGVHQFSNPGLGNTIEVKGGDGGFAAIDQNEPQYQFGTYTNNVYQRSTDGGASWNTVSFSSTGRFINPYDYDNTANIMYCGDDASKFRRWTDPQTGSTSDVVSITNMTGEVTAVSVSPFTSHRVFFGTNSGKIVQVDGANTIVSGSAGTDLSSGLPGGTVSCINFGTSGSNLIICESNYGINNVWVSTDGGATWVAIDGNLPDMPVRWCMFYPGDNTKAYIATETGVWETALISGGSTVWTADPTFPAVRTDMIKYRSGDQEFAAATHGRGLWTSNISTLPVQLASFSARYINSAGVRIDWRTISEINNYGFEVQKSPNDHLNYQSIDGSFTAGQGTTNEPHDYSWIEQNAQPGRWFYRLKQIDLDGTVHYFDGVLVDVLTSIGDHQTPAQFSLYQNYPNPFNPATTFRFDLPAAGKARLTIIDISGKVVAEIANGQMDAGKHSLTWNASGFASGVYIYRLHAGEFVATKKLVLVR